MLVFFSFCRFLIVLACLILSVLSTIDQYQALAHETLFFVVSIFKMEDCLILVKSICFMPGLYQHGLIYIL